MKFETLAMDCWLVRCKDCRKSVVVYDADHGHDWMAAHVCGAAR